MRAEWGSRREFAALRSRMHGACVVMVCADISEADQVGRRLLDLNMGYLITYQRVEDLMCNAPAGKVALVILATEDRTPILHRTLRWLRHRWPSCPVTVVGNEGCSESEMTSRMGGASYLTRPVMQQEWSAILGHALGAKRDVESVPVKII